MVKISGRVLMVFIWLLCVILLGVVIYQFILINSKQAHLREVVLQSEELEREIVVAEDLLREVGSLEFLELQARKRGLGYSDERRFIA